MHRVESIRTLSKTRIFVPMEGGCEKMREDSVDIHQRMDMCMTASTGRSKRADAGWVEHQRHDTYDAALSICGLRVCHWGSAPNLTGCPNDQSDERQRRVPVPGERACFGVTSDVAGCRPGMRKEGTH